MAYNCFVIGLGGKIRGNFWILLILLALWGGSRPWRASRRKSKGPSRREKVSILILVLLLICWGIWAPCLPSLGPWNSISKSTNSFFLPESLGVEAGAPKESEKRWSASLTSSSQLPSGSRWTRGGERLCFGLLWAYPLHFSHMILWCCGLACVGLTLTPAPPVMPREGSQDV